MLSVVISILSLQNNLYVYAIFSNLIEPIEPEQFVKKNHDVYELILPLVVVHHHYKKGFQVHNKIAKQMLLFLADTFKL